MKKSLQVITFILTVLIIVGCQSSSKTENSTEPTQQAQNVTEKENSLDEKEMPNREKTNQDTEKQLPSGELQVHFIDVGQGDATLLQFAHGNEKYAILIDAGDFTGNEVVPYLRNQGVEKLNIAIGTHPDADHIGQLDDVLTSLEVEEVWLSGNESSSDTFLSVLQAIEQSDAAYEEPRMRDTYSIGPLNIQVLYPRQATGKSNEESISLKISYGEIDFIFTGDANKDSELDMIRNGLDVSGDILHLGHHGSSTSTDETFLQAVKPKLAIYSAGKDNSYGHPHMEVVQLIKDSGIPLYGTDVHGTIIVTTDGQKFSVVTEKKGTMTSNNQTVTEKPTSPPPVEKNNSCININTASKEEIEKIIHIGPERAQDVINLRPFKSVEDLDRIKGIGPARIKDIVAEGLACVGG